jgi:hypothetical protein
MNPVPDPFGGPMRITARARLQCQFQHADVAQGVFADDFLPHILRRVHAAPGAERLLPDRGHVVQRIDRE